MKCLLQGKVDILTITESTIDNSFITTQFFIDGYSKPFSFNRNRNGGGAVLYVRDDITCRELKSDNLPNDIE